jgi:hypothetical protein
LQEFRVGVYKPEVVGLVQRLEDKGQGLGVRV